MDVLTAINEQQLKTIYNWYGRKNMAFIQGFIVLDDVHNSALAFIGKKFKNVHHKVPWKPIKDYLHNKFCMQHQEWKAFDIDYRPYFDYFEYSHTKEINANFDDEEFDIKHEDALPSKLVHCVINYTMRLLKELGYQPNFVHGKADYTLIPYVEDQLKKNPSAKIIVKSNDFDLARGCIPVMRYFCTDPGEDKRFSHMSRGDFEYLYFKQCDSEKSFQASALKNLIRIFKNPMKREYLNALLEVEQNISLKVQQALNTLQKSKDLHEIKDGLMKLFQQELKILKRELNHEKFQKYFHDVENVYYYFQYLVYWHPIHGLTLRNEETCEKDLKIWKGKTKEQFLKEEFQLLRIKQKLSYFKKRNSLLIVKPIHECSFQKDQKFREAERKRIEINALDKVYKHYLYGTHPTILNEIKPSSTNMGTLNWPRRNRR